jgi:hypothetical protein
MFNTSALAAEFCFIELAKFGCIGDVWISNTFYFISNVFATFTNQIQI